MEKCCEEFREEFWDDGNGLSGEQAEALHRHLAECPACAAEYREIRKIKEATCGEEPVPQELRARVMASVRETPQRKKRRFIPVGTIAAAALILVLFGINRVNLSAFGCAGGLASDKAESNAQNSVMADENVVFTAEKAEDTDQSQFGVDWFGVAAGYVREDVGLDASQITVLYVAQQAAPETVAALVGDEAVCLSQDGNTLYLLPLKDTDTAPFDAAGWQKYTWENDSGSPYLAVLEVAG